MGPVYHGRLTRHTGVRRLSGGPDARKSGYKPALHCDIERRKKESFVRHLKYTLVDNMHGGRASEKKKTKRETRVLYPGSMRGSLLVPFINPLRGHIIFIRLKG